MSDKKLITVEELKVKAENDKYKNVPGSESGVACPACGEELFRAVIGSQGIDNYNKGKKLPVQHPHFCRNCNWDGWLPIVPKPLGPDPKDSFPEYQKKRREQFDRIMGDRPEPPTMEKWRMGYYSPNNYDKKTRGLIFTLVVTGSMLVLFLYGGCQ